ncbi:hypothetical protein SH139x_002770 [Planctomycetaceae bacterium SH139]
MSLASLISPSVLPAQNLTIGVTLWNGANPGPSSQALVVIDINGRAAGVNSMLTLEVRVGGFWVASVQREIATAEAAVRLTLDEITWLQGENLTLTLSSDDAGDNNVSLTTKIYNRTPLQPLAIGRDLDVNASGHVARVMLVDTTTTNTDMRGTNGANTITPLSASGVRAAVGLASANLDTQLGSKVTNTQLQAALPANFAALGINASGHISRVTLVDTTTTNSDMRGTDGANTVVPLSASGVRTAVGLASANLDTQLTGLLTETDLLAALPSNFAALGINASGHISRVTLVDTTTTNSDMRGTDGANTVAPLSAGGVRAAVGLATANLDTQLSSLLTEADLLTALPTNFAALGINASGHISRVTLVDTTTTNSDMRGTEGANTIVPLSASGVRTAIGLATANLDTQLTALLTEADLLAALPSNFAALGINASGHISRVTLVDTTTTNTDMRGTDGANTLAPPSAAVIRDAVLDTVLVPNHNVLGSLSDFIQTTSLAVDDVIKSGEERTLTRTGKDPVTFTETRVLN